LAHEHAGDAAEHLRSIEGPCALDLLLLDGREGSGDALDLVRAIADDAHLDRLGLGGFVGARLPGRVLRTSRRSDRKEDDREERRGDPHGALQIPIMLQPDEGGGQSEGSSHGSVQNVPLAAYSWQIADAHASFTMHGSRKPASPPPAPPDPVGLAPGVVPQNAHAPYSDPDGSHCA
jgi:hypothetical protein